jgi:hypothetical protein
MSGSTCIRHQSSPPIISALIGVTTSQLQNLTRGFKPSLRHRIHLRDMQGTTARHHSRCKIFCVGLERLFPSALLQAPAKSLEYQHFLRLSMSKVSPFILSFIALCSCSDNFCFLPFSFRCLRRAECPWFRAENVR